MSNFYLLYFLFFFCIFTVYQQYVFTCQYNIQSIGKPMDQNILKLKLDCVNEKIKVCFPDDPKGDIKIMFKSQKYNLQKAYLRLSSKKFRTQLQQNTANLQINEQFDEQAFKKILSLLFGYTVTIQRAEISKYYFIIKYLEIQQILTYLKSDFVKNISHYDIFDVIGIANKIQDQELFSFCVQQLEKQKYQQIIYHQHGLLHLQLSLFKLIIKSHNQFKKHVKTNVSYIKINQLLDYFCSIHNYCQQRCHQLKFQLFDISVLSAQDYKEIFVTSLIQSDQAQSVQKKSSLLQSLTFKEQKKSNANIVGLCKSLKNSKIQSFEIKSNSQLKLQMIITFLKKRNEELQNQNDFLTNQIQCIRKITTANQDIHKQMEKDIKFLRQQLSRKETINQEHRKIINKLEPLMIKLQRQIEKKTEQIDKLIEVHQKRSIERQKQKSNKEISKPISVKPPETQKSSEQQMVQSQFLSANFIHQMFSGGDVVTPIQAVTPSPKVPVPKRLNKNKKPEPVKQVLTVIESLDDDEIEEMYSHRIQFDQQPCSIHKFQLPKLCKMLANDFNKKHLKLIYRRSFNHPAIGSKLDIRNRQALLVLINTESGQHIGGFLKSQIPQQKVSYLTDKNAYLFTLTGNKKLTVNPNEASEAIFLSDGYLLSFSNDLMIANDCLTEKSLCYWPTSYGKTKNQKNDNTWFAGASQFLIKDLQIFQVLDAQMEMVL